MNGSDRLGGPPARRISRLGYCAASDHEAQRRLESQGPDGLRGLPGEYVFVVEEPDGVSIVTSPNGVHPYYYRIHESRLLHGDTVLSVLQQAPTERAWNWPAVADVALLEHTTGTDTLHPQVRRVPPDTVLRWSLGRGHLATPAWRYSGDGKESSPAALLEALHHALERDAGPGSVLSMSAGYDSRVILAGLQQLGRQTPLLVMGFADSTDRKAAEAAARMLGLEVAAVEVRPADYLERGPAISALTGGAKSAEHWHTGIYVRKAGMPPGTPMLLGSNGEFARTYYADKGLAAAAAACAPAPSAKRAFWRRKLRPLFRPDELHHLAPGLAEQFAGDGMAERVHRLTGMCPGGLLPGLDRFYLEQRVRCFIGNGLRLFSEDVSCRTPFLDPDWIAGAVAIGRYWKLGSNWHRFAVAQDCPMLLDLPIKGRHRMERRAPLAYWTSSARRPGERAYADYPEWFAGRDIRDYLTSSRSALHEVVSPELVRAIVGEHAASRSRTRTIGFLLCIAHWADHLRALEGGSDRPEDGRTQVSEPATLN